MANSEHLAILKSGVDTWNKWRTDVEFVDRRGRRTFYFEGHYGKSKLIKQLRPADLHGADLTSAWLDGALLDFADLSGATLCDAHLDGAQLHEAKLSEANLERASLLRAYLGGVDLSSARLKDAILNGATLSGATLTEAQLRYAWLREADLTGAKFQNAHLEQADLQRAILTRADLTGAYLNDANLREAVFIETNLSNAILSGCRVYGTSVWGVNLHDAQQSNLCVTSEGAPSVTVDNLEVAQFVHLLLNREKLRNVIDTITSKAVLILGRFTPERKIVLNAIADELRLHKLLPIIFDFERPTDRDFSETIRILAGMSLFVIIDITNPKSAPLELQALVPDYQVPFVPIIQDEEKPFSMFRDLQKYDWVFKPVITYPSIAVLTAAFKEAILDRAFAKHQELIRLKSQEISTKSAIDYLSRPTSFSA